MLAIRMQRTGRKGRANFRIVVQDSRQTPSSGKFVELLGHYNPHTKTAEIAKEKASFYLEHGAQPSDSAAKLLKREGVKLPKWASISTDIKREVRNPEKLRKNQPKVDEKSEDKTTEDTGNEITEQTEQEADTSAETKSEDKDSDKND